MKKYKLTNLHMQTYEGCQWELNVQKTTLGNSHYLSNDQWLYYYHNPLLAVLFNPIYNNVTNPRLFEVKALGKHLDNNGVKGGCTKLTLIKEIELPIITLNQKVAFGILCALEVYENKDFIKWANNWLNDTDRTKESVNNIIDKYNTTYYAYVARNSYDAITNTNPDDYVYSADAAAYINASLIKKLNLVKLIQKAITYS